jgi:hypothetical protein
VLNQTCQLSNAPLNLGFAPGVAERYTYPFDIAMSFSLPGVPCAAKLATRNQDVCLFSLGPYEVPTTYLMISPPFLVVVISGSAPRRPTRVRRASWDGRVEENARATMAEEVARGARVTMRRGERVDNIVSTKR